MTDVVSDQATQVTPIMLVTSWPVRAAGLAATFFGALGGGWSASADVGALIGGLCGAGALLFSIIWNNRNNKRAEAEDERQRTADLLSAETRGYKRAKAEDQPWIDYYKNLAQGRLRLPPDQPSERDT